MTGEQFPSWVDGSGTTNPGPNLAYTFDSMGRPSTLTEENASVDVITGAGYGPANEMTSMSGSWGSEDRTYNSLKQVTGIFSTGVYATYAYPSTNNNGKISSQYDGVTGETVTYAFDTLNRLITATSSVSGNTQGFSYDGFGNLDGASGANAFSTSYNQSTNQALACTDANGNSASTSMAGTTGCSGAYLNTYDVTNRIVATWEGMYYSYAPGSKRVWRGSWTGSGEAGYTPATDEITFWSMRGQKMASYQITLVQGCCEGTDSYMAPKFYITPTATNYYFAGRLVKNGNGNNWVYADRLGSIGRYYSYGQDKGSSNPTSGDKFAGQYQDSETGLNYTDQRYYAPGSGRFMTPDRAGHPRSASPSSWNMYTYTGDDPVNRADPHGTDDTDVDCSDPDAVCPVIFYTSGTGSADPDTEIADLEEAGGNPCSGLQGDDPSDLGQACDNFLVLADAIQVQTTIAQPPGGQANYGIVNSEISAAVDLAITALQDNPTCMNLLGTGKLADGSVVSGVEVLFAGTAFGTISPGLIIDTNANTITNAETICCNLTLVGYSGNSVQIVLNDLPGTTFNGGGVVAQATTLLHELGHAMNDIFGVGTSGIGPDSNQNNAGVGLSISNTDLITENCFPNP